MKRKIIFTLLALCVLGLVLFLWNREKVYDFDKDEDLIEFMTGGKMVCRTEEGFWKLDPEQATLQILKSHMPKEAQGDFE